MQKKGVVMRKGFTLIELLIVIAVISILIGIALPRFKGMQDEGNIAKAKGELKTLQVAVESYYIHNNNTYPATGSAALETALASATPSIITSVPTDPFRSTGADYVYVRGGTNGKYYIIYSVGPGGNGSASISSNAVSETNGSSCIYVSNMGEDVQP
ncbi:MAG: type II secretion system GspH family protein [Candidatus Omnitrophica bacterium]|nr:type II secretion system GspH family protein [Candidatus Omnitrophota bacterium]MBU1933075.1 type II secretion system GspH family protein [Candidatus Omnitrophota bacterium]